MTNQVKGRLLAVCCSLIPLVAIAQEPAQGPSQERSPDVSMLEYLGMMVEKDGAYIDPLVLEGEAEIVRKDDKKARAEKSAEEEPL